MTMYIISWSLASHLSEFRETYCSAEGLVIRMFEENEFVLLGEIHFLLWRISITTLETTRTPYPENWHIWSAWGLMVLGVPGHHRFLPRHSDTILFDILLSLKLVTWRMPVDAKWLGYHCRFVNRVWMLLGHAWNSFLAKRKIRKRETRSARVDGPRYNKREGHPKCLHSGGPDSSL